MGRGTARKGIEIKAVAPGGLAEGAGVSPGDALLQVNGEDVLDGLNYQFLVAQRDRTEILVKKCAGGLLCATLENGGDALGLELAEDEIRVCAQNCVFCFVRQMPRGFRPSLYVKDEDIRLSFLRGHFTTLSNSDGAELDRIIRERLSPLHISVHATDPAARSRMVGNPGQGDILGKMDRLIRGGIEMHAQAVIAPGYNDGGIWEGTLADLWARRAPSADGRTDGRTDGRAGGVLSLSCVPVGLTGHRQNLPRIREIDSGYAAAWAGRWKREAARLAAANGDPWLLLADEWFTRAGMGVPGRRFYPRDWSQAENGVGLLRRFLDHAGRFAATAAAGRFRGLRLLLLTGTSFAPHLSRVAEALNQRVGSGLAVAAVPNAAFGASVTVAGLLCGRDLLGAAKKNMRRADGWAAEVVVVPGAAVQAAEPGRGHPGSRRFLDDMTVSELQSMLGAPVALGGDNLSQLLAGVARAKVGING
jgi:putative radical SAM enzyme (TIGR03279 family)